MTVLPVCDTTITRVRREYREGRSLEKMWNYRIDRLVEMTSDVRRELTLHHNVQRFLGQSED